MGKRWEEGKEERRSVDEEGEGEEEDGETLKRMIEGEEKEEKQEETGKESAEQVRLYCNSGC